MAQVARELLEAPSLLSLAEHEQPRAAALAHEREGAKQGREVLRRGEPGDGEQDRRAAVTQPGMIRGSRGVELDARRERVGDHRDVLSRQAERLDEVVDDAVRHRHHLIRSRVRPACGRRHQPVPYPARVEDDA